MTLAELLVAAGVSALAAGAALAAVAPAQRAFAAQPEVAGLSQRTRVVVDLLAADVRRAALVLPYRVGDIDSDAVRGVFYRPDVITILTDPVDALARGIIAPSETRTYHLKQDGSGTWQLMQYDGHASDQAAVEDVVALNIEYFGEALPPTAAISEHGVVRVTYGAPPPPLAIDDPADSWGAGENCTIAAADGTYVARLAALASGGLVPLEARHLTDGPWCPDASSAFRFDADLLRVRRVRIQIRLQAAHPFRGLAGRWFLNSGSGADPARLVPDEQVVLDVAPRNIDVAR